MQNSTVLPSLFPLFLPFVYGGYREGSDETITSGDRDLPLTAASSKIRAFDPQGG